MSKCYAFVLYLVLAPMVAAQEQSPVRRIDIDRSTSTSRGVVVSKEATLARTKQFLPGVSDSLQAQVLSLQEQLATARAEYRSTHLVQVNFYASGPESLAALLEGFAPLFANAPPALTMVETRLPGAADVAVDALFTVADPIKVVTRTPQVALQPPSGTVYIAGQAENADNLRAATLQTYKSLAKTIEFLGLELADVVSIKAFLSPMIEAETVREVTKEFFDRSEMPPLSLVEWQSTLPIEIEMVVADTRPDIQMPTVEFLTPPGMTTSPVYSRVARVGNVPVLYVSGLYGTGDANQQVREIFQSLAEVCNSAGTDFRHLAKATYYCSTDEVSRSLNDLRPNYYDPKRPPAASKAMVLGVGRAGSTITVDMIAPLMDAP